MGPNEEVKVQEQVTVEKEPAQGPASPSVRVKVLAKEGIFKNGKLYATGEELEMHPDTAANFAKINNVEVLTPTPAAPTEAAPAEGVIQ